MRPIQPVEQHRPEEPGCAGLILRLLWFPAGHLALVVFGLLIAQRGRLSFLDAAYGFTILAILAVRYVDIVRFGGLTRNATPATLRDWRRHVLLLTLIGGAIWALIHACWQWVGR